MNYLAQNITVLTERFGVNSDELLESLNVDEVTDLSISDLAIIAEQFKTDLKSLLFKPFITKEKEEILDNIRLLILDVDGVMTDGGMYFTEGGDQFKKFNTKDGMAIIHLTKSDFQIAIISSGFSGKAVKQRAEMLGIQHCYVGREAKINVLNGICEELQISLKQVAMIGDDINDQEVMRQIGITFCPNDAVDSVKETADIILEKKGGEGCVRELIDNYILKQPLSR